MKSQTFEISEPTDAEKEATLNSFFSMVRHDTKERKAAAESAILAFERLLDAMSLNTGQSYKIRALLYSLWNGQPTTLSQTLELDWTLKKDVCSVILAFGFEAGKPAFFYDHFKTALQAYGLFEWFLEEGNAE